MYFLKMLIITTVRKFLEIWRNFQDNPEILIQFNLNYTREDTQLLHYSMIYWHYNMSQAGNRAVGCGIITVVHATERKKPNKQCACCQGNSSADLPHFSKGRDELQSQQSDSPLEPPSPQQITAIQLWDLPTNCSGEWSWDQKGFMWGVHKAGCKEIRRDETKPVSVVQRLAFATSIIGNTVPCAISCHLV